MKVPRFNSILSDQGLRVVREQTEMKAGARNEFNARFSAVAQKVFAGDVEKTIDWTGSSAFALDDGDLYRGCFTLFLGFIMRQSLRLVIFTI